jgi:hypothetical protein
LAARKLKILSCTHMMGVVAWIIRQVLTSLFATTMDTRNAA